MKKNRLTTFIQHSINWRRLPAAAVLSAACLASGIHPVYAQDPSQNTVALNFVSADIESVVKAIGHYTGTTFIIDPRVKGQITLVSEKPLTKDQAFKLLTSTLRLQGYTVVTGDGYAKVVPEADAKLQPGPIQTPAVKGDQIATQIFRLDYETANNIVTVLRPLISPNNTINANPGNNSVVITDYADNLKRLGKIIASLDMPSVSDMDVIPIKHAIASDIAAMVTRLTETTGAGAGPDGGRTVLLADPRTNSILIKAPSVARAGLVKTLIAKLDQPTALPGNVHVVYLKNAEAVKLAQTLRSIVTQDSSLPSSSSSSTLSSSSSLSSGAGGTGNPASSGLNSSTSSSLPSSPSSNAGSALSSGGAGGFIQADAATNTLVITASEAVYRNLRNVIDQLDARRAQVYIETLIVEVTANKTNEFGVQWLALTGDANSNYRVGGGTAFSTGGNNLIQLAAGGKTAASSLSNGLTVGIFRQIGGQLGLGALAHALESQGGTNVLSIPTLLTLDNEEAKIIVGQNVPFITGQFTTSAATGTAGVNPFQTIERKDVGIKLRVRPQISEGGTVKLSIFQEVSNVDSATNPAGIITNQRSIETNVLAEDGDIIALGGLIDDKGTDTNEKVPLLGDIPIIGNLFKYQTGSRTKTNLMVFLRPTVLRSAEQGNSVSIDRYDYMKTQIAPAKEGGSAPLFPEVEKGKLMVTPLTIPSDKMPEKQLDKPAQ
ncbi:type II secretion system secretin GspD [Undibacterium sp.]|jgi:general secretion pathway protein D|uniref:type II secretion system secretin GspD n=1 Tax=Undibacterium sp. TaxID=1914977 RepID=UPI002C5B5DE6|nr:type II secretion system secretin GspD [Undibacterium sp.]HTD02354.1 type II secretion system secretin GspD [Undibacterium sp.]